MTLLNRPNPLYGRIPFIQTLSFSYRLANHFSYRLANHFSYCLANHSANL